MYIFLRQVLYDSSLLLYSSLFIIIIITIKKNQLVVTTKDDDLVFDSSISPRLDPLLMDDESAANLLNTLPLDVSIEPV
jgi:hypothetical protein